MFQKIGCFHFGGSGMPDEPPPVAALQCALATKGKEHLMGSLVVLPEAFNLKGAYEPRATYEFENNVGQRLAGLAEEYELVFVVGLIEADAAKPYSSVYLVTPDRCHLLGRKTGEDDTAKGREGTSKLYLPSAECDNPISYNGACIAALICMDANDSERGNRLRSKFVAGDVIVCVAAATSRFSMAADWSNVHFVLANAFPNCFPRGSPSIIAIKGQDPILRGEQTNVVIVEPLSQ